jgi:hypothetical protein
VKWIATLLVSLLLTAQASQTDVLSATVVSVKKYGHGHILYWEGRVPIYDGRPVYDITLAVDGKEYIVRYESNTGYYPAAWEAGKQLQVKKLKGRFMLMNRDEEISAQIVTKDECIPHPTRNQGVPLLPCP